jgi:hypothetical protein
MVMIIFASERNMTKVVIKIAAAEKKRAIMVICDGDKGIEKTRAVMVIRVLRRQELSW